MTEKKNTGRSSAGGAERAWGIKEKSLGSPTPCWFKSSHKLKILSFGRRGMKAKKGPSTLPFSAGI
jgi:hypothetical protein